MSASWKNNKSRQRILVATISAGLVAFVVGYFTRSALAEGIPDTEALTYSGMLYESGEPVTDDKTLVIKLWDAATGGNELCITSAADVPVEEGRFRVALDDTCTDAVSANPDTWVEVSVGTETLPRTKLGAVPYAVEARGVAAGLPVGSIIPWYDGNGALGVPDCWQLADGSQIVDLRSPIDGHYTPNLTGDTYVTGTSGALDWSAGDPVTAGLNTVAATVPAHYHGKGTLSIGSSGGHSHTYTRYAGKIHLDAEDTFHDLWNYDTTATTGGTGDHTHPNSSISGSVGATSGSNGDAALTASGSFTDNRPQSIRTKFIMKICMGY